MKSLLFVTCLVGATTALQVALPVGQRVASVRSVADTPTREPFRSPALTRRRFALSAAEADGSDGRSHSEHSDRETPDATQQQDTGVTVEPEAAKIIRFLTKKFPSFYRTMPSDIRTKLVRQLSDESTAAFTIFAPNEQGFEALGKKKRSQLKDPRNAETVEKLIGYHIVEGSTITATELKTEDWTRGRPKDGSLPNTVIAGVLTLSGEVPVGRRKEGGFLGFAAKETGDIVVGPSANILQSFKVDQCMVHEMDALVSPEILWRYCDQLQINLPPLR